MKPSIVAPNLKKTVLTYLTSTFGLVEDDTADALADFFSDPDNGLFRGPYLRVRSKFRDAPDDWQIPLGWSPPDFTPRLHQAKAWQRLSSLNDRTPGPTIVATGTGSGKTESFLVPVLDHCARHAADPGVKAVVIYPMNALATDQAARLDTLLADNAALKDVTAGLYVGEQSATSYRRLLTERADMRMAPPDLLLTNYKMLDLLLARAEDAPLWADGKLSYLVIDEFHTFNGAQGTDVAMLLRRLKAVCGTTPTPVATSATLGDDEQARDVAGVIFGHDFAPGSVIAEDRLSPNEYVADVDSSLPTPTVQELAYLPDPYEYPEATAALCEAVLGSAGLTPAQAGVLLRRHKLLLAVLDGFSSGKLMTADDFFEELGPWVMESWKDVWESSGGHDLAVVALERLLALISWARDGDRPLLQVETHVWIRSVSRLLRSVPAADTKQDEPEDEQPIGFAWAADAPKNGRWLPAISCRHCGRSGWMVKVKQLRRDQLKLSPEDIYTQSRVDRRQTRALIAAYPREEQEFKPKAPVETNPPLKRLNGESLDDYEEGKAGVPVLVDLDSDTAAGDERCPACNSENAIRFIGAGLATLSSVVLTEVFQRAVDTDSGDLAKALVFNDSVQDAAHRAGFLSARASNFSLRTHLSKVLTELDQPDMAEAIAEALVGMALDPDALASVIPADIHADPGVARLLSGDDRGSGQTWLLIGRRLAFAVMLEFGLRSYVGRTLERAGVVATHIDLPERTRTVLRDVLTRSGARLFDATISDETLAWHARGVIDRLLIRGGIWHDWLNGWIRGDGAQRWQVWGGRPYGMPAFPEGVSAPRFMLDGGGSRSQFDRLDTSGENWLTDWTRRVLHLNASESRKYLRQLLRLLADQGVISRIPTQGGTVYALTAGQLRFERLGKEEAKRSQVGCDVCAWQRTVPPSERDVWIGKPCPRWRCGGHMRQATWHDDYYFDRYTVGSVHRLQAAEHTGVLSREQRETVEAQFKNAAAWDAPNVLTATSTLELGIDIGDLSTVALAGIPPEPASYVQRSGRAGRTTGNALTVAFADRSPRDLAFFTDPDVMVNGTIRPPGARLEAMALLRRQYAAYLVDKTARSVLNDVEPLPHLASAVFGPGAWLERFTRAALAGAARYGDEFCALFGDRIDPEIAKALRQWAGAGIDRDIAAAAEHWQSGLERLRDRLAALRSARGELEAAPESRPEKGRDLRVLRAEERTVRKRLSSTEHGTTAHTALTEGGLLPNYALIDSAVTLEATLTFVRQESPDAPREFVTELRDYQRPASIAVTEFAPGNHVYFRGYAHEVKGLDLGGKDAPEIATWWVCPYCGAVVKATDDTVVGACPRCDTNISDVGNRYDVVVPRTVYAYDRAADIRIDDRTDDRDRRLYNAVTTAEVTAAAQTWRAESGNFGFDYSPDAVIRHINLGPIPKIESPEFKDMFAGAERIVNPFWVCRECGGTKLDDNPTGKGDPRWNPEADPYKRHHRFWCPNRDNDRPHQSVLLAHELHTEVLRFLLPMVGDADTRTILSFQAALAAGINAYFEGDTSHLVTETCTMADVRKSESDDPPRTRVFTVLYDQLRSGTGYLKQLADPETMRQVLQRAVEFCDGCGCTTACHRCLLAFTRQRHYSDVNRFAAVELLQTKLLDRWDMTTVDAITDISLNEVADSRLEKNFNNAVHELAATRNSGFTIEKGAKRERILSFTRDGSPPVKWRMQTQQRHSVVATVPDFTFTRIDGPPERVQLYLDGFDYHARPEFNRDRRGGGKPTRTGEDAAIRAQLLDNGDRVFAATWHDVTSLGGSGAFVDLIGEDNRGGAAETFGITVGDLKEEVVQNPLSFMLDYLANPDPLKQHKVARAVCLAMILDNGHRQTARESDVETAVTSLADGVPVEAGAAGLLGVSDTRFLRVAAGFDTLNAAEARVYAQAVFDDDPDVDTAAQEPYRRAWHTWLRWSNVLQFLDGADVFTQRTTTMLTPAPTGFAARLDAVRPVLTVLYDVDGAAMRNFGELLLRRGASEPAIGEEHVNGIPAELAWPAARVAVFPDPDDSFDSTEYITEYRNAGWHAAAKSDWDIDELLDLLATPTPTEEQK